MLVSKDRLWEVNLELYQIWLKRNKGGKEATMTLNKLFHWVRVVVMFLSGGFIFPHAMTEDMDIAKPGTDKDAKVKKQ